MDHPETEELPSQPQGRSQLRTEVRNPDVHEEFHDTHGQKGKGARRQPACVHVRGGFECGFVCGCGVYVGACVLWVRVFFVRVCALLLLRFGEYDLGFRVSLTRTKSHNVMCRRLPGFAHLFV